MRNINLLCPPGLAIRKQSQKVLLLLILAGLIPFVIIKTIASFLDTGIFATSARVATLESKQLLLMRRSESDVKFQIKSEIQDLNIIANTIAKEIILLDLKRQSNLLTIHGRAADASTVMAWSEILKTQLSQYKLKINYIKKDAANAFFNFELQLNKQ